MTTPLPSKDQKDLIRQRRALGVPTQELFVQLTYGESLLAQMYAILKQLKRMEAEVEAIRSTLRIRKSGR
jgi:hypothetical protein